LPKYIQKNYYALQLQQAEQVFRQHARGAAADKYLKQLAEECERVWCNGRQQCEEISLTGKPCVNQVNIMI
jgi:protein SMG8